MPLRTLVLIAIAAWGFAAFGLWVCVIHSTSDLQYVAEQEFRPPRAMLIPYYAAIRQIAVAGIQFAGICGLILGPLVGLPAMAAAMTTFVLGQRRILDSNEPADC